MKRVLWLSLAVLVLCGLGLAAWYRFRPAPVRKLRAEEYRFRSLDVITAHLALLEKPDVRKVYLADEAAEAYRPYFEHAGLSCASNGTEGVFGLVFVGGTGSHDWRALSAKTSEMGAMAWAVDVRGMSAATFRKALTDFPCEQAHLWMPGENDWLLTGRMKPCCLKFDALLDCFSPDGSTADLVEAECESLTELFASYVGSREEALPAFQGDLKAPVRCEFFITKDVPELDWIAPGETDDDIWQAAVREIRSMQVVRRQIVEGNMLAVQNGKIDEAIDRWASAMLRNPHDIMLLDRLYRLAVNGRAFEKLGNLKGAAKCYETMIAVRPRDAATMRRYAECMRMLGQREIAEAAEKRAKELMK